MFKHNWAWIQLATYNSSTVLTRNLKNPRDYAPLIVLEIKNNKQSQGKRYNYKRSATGKKGGGIAGITKTPSAVSRWALSHNLRYHIAAQTSAMFDIHHDDRLIHKESDKERQKQDNEAVTECSIFYTTKIWGVLATDKWDTAEHYHKTSCDSRNCAVYRPSSFFWDRPSLKDSLNRGYYLQTEKKKNGGWKKGRNKTSVSYSRE